MLRAGAVRCFGLDLSLEAIQYAKSAYSGCTFAACDATRLCLADQSVDLIVSFETIEHLAAPSTFLAECRRVLRPNGVLVCSTPNREISRWGPGNAFHVAEMKPGELLGLMREYFVGCELYGQRDVQYSLCVAKSMAVNLLEKTRLRSFVRKALRRFKPLPLAGICTETEFPERNGHHPQLAVGPYIPKWQHRPAYVLAIGRKPMSPTL